MRPTITPSANYQSIPLARSAAAASAIVIHVIDSPHLKVTGYPVDARVNVISLGLGFEIEGNKAVV